LKGKGKIAGQAMFAAMSNVMLLLTMIMMILLGRYLGPDNLGLFSYAQSLAMVVVGFGNFGLSTLVVRDVAKDNSLAPRYFAATMPWVAALTTLILLGMLGVIAVARPGDTQFLKISALVGAAIAFRVLGTMARGFMQGLQRFDYECGSIALENVVMIPVGVGLLVSGFDLTAFCIGLMVSRAVGLIFYLSGLRRIMPLRLTRDIPLLKSLQKQSLSIGLSQNIHFASIHVDTLIISAFVPIAQVGFFSAAFKVYVGTMIVPMFAVSLLLPKLSASMIGTKEKHNALLMMGIFGMLGVSLVALVVGYPLVPWGIHLLYGNKFDDAIPVMRLLLVAMIPTFQFFFMNSYLVAIGHNKAYMAFTMTGLMIRVGLGIVMVQKMGIHGTAITICIAETTAVLGIWIYLLRVHFKPGSPAEMILKLRQALSELTLRQ